jgi:hypothetical protein
MNATKVRPERPRFWRVLARLRAAARSLRLLRRDGPHLLSVAPTGGRGGGFLLFYVHDHDGDVIHAAGIEGCPDEGVGCPFGAFG